MQINDNIKEIMITAMAKVFSVDKDTLNNNLNLNLLDDLHATSIQYFPVISALEDALDIELQYQDFRREGKTISDAIEFVVTEYQKVYGKN